MAVCKECKDEVDELVKIKFGGRTLRLCEDCADLKREELEIAEMSEDAIRDMMGYKGSY
jgi:ribosome-binding protein aMBF1 (putative translation factor)